jgi:hypothetical protein
MKPVSPLSAGELLRFRYAQYAPQALAMLDNGQSPLEAVFYWFWVQMNGPPPVNMWVETKFRTAHLSDVRYAPGALRQFIVEFLYDASHQHALTGAVIVCSR